MNGKRALRWFFTALFAGLGAGLLVACVWSLFTAPVSGAAGIVFYGVGLCLSGALLHWAYLIFLKQYREFAAVFSCVVALLVAAVLISLPIWNNLFQRYDAWWKAHDRHPLGSIVGLCLALAVFAVPYVVARWVFRRGQSLILKLLGEPSTRGRLLQ